MSGRKCVVHVRDDAIRVTRASVSARLDISVLLWLHNLELNKMIDE